MGSQFYDANTQKITELLPRVQWACQAWMDDAWKQSKFFRILCAFRSQEEQDRIYHIGRRGIPGEKPVTWTHDSEHTKRLAVDIFPTNCTFKDLDPLAQRYGIFRPLATKAVGDLAHYDLTNVPPNGYADPLQPSREADQKRFLNAIKRLEPGNARDRAIARYKERYGVMPTIT